MKCCILVNQLKPCKSNFLVGNSSYRLVERQQSTDCQTVCLSVCLSVWLTDWLTDWRTDGLTEWLTDWLTPWLTILTDWLTVWRPDEQTGGLSECMTSVSALSEELKGMTHGLKDGWTDRRTDAISEYAIHVWLSEVTDSLSIKTFKLNLLVVRSNLDCSLSHFPLMINGTPYPPCPPFGQIFFWLQWCLSTPSGDKTNLVDAPWHCPGFL